MTDPGKRWFRPKTLGYGASPNTWQGWVMTLGFIVLVMAEAFYLKPLIGPGPAAAAILASVGLFILAVYRLSGRQWRWRNGRSED